MKDMMKNWVENPMKYWQKEEEEDKDNCRRDWGE